MGGKIATSLSGAGVIAVEMAAPQLWPDAPEVIWRIMFWIGVALFFTGPIWWLRENFDSLPGYRSRIPLKNALRIAYEQTRHTASGYAAERMAGIDDGADGILKYYFYALTQDPPVTILGKRLPSQKIEEIPQSEWEKYGLSDDVQSLFDRYNDHLVYDEICVTKKSLRRKIKEISGWSSKPRPG